MNFLDLIKRLPIDLGQGHYRHTTKAKVTAFRMTGDGHGRRALDLGCGDGFWSRKLKGHNWQVTSADGYDFRSPDTIEVDAEKPFPFSNQEFDLIWSSEVIEHIRNVDQFVSEMRRIIKPDGRIIVTTPNSHFWLYRLLLPFGIKPATIQNPDHKQFFSLADMRRLFPRAHIYGFFPYTLVKIIITRGIDFLSPTFIVVEHQKSKYTVTH
ncbi:MAG: class I SAM-dependent methyltransferase [Candidatus Andersenbacteria bacterium]|nr:class I SAM-dependent methyltransferase [Candidatus Andersenbacteria bacterium]MBI3250260.1 class I SAM-dependent methyltransferase [Candidatus Andersenbacteria bacterium]